MVSLAGQALDRSSEGVSDHVDLVTAVRERDQHHETGRAFDQRRATGAGSSAQDSVRDDGRPEESARLAALDPQR
jgi:hypothetical protein